MYPIVRTCPLKGQDLMAWTLCPLTFTYSEHHKLLYNEVKIIYILQSEKCDRGRKAMGKSQFVIFSRKAISSGWGFGYQYRI